MCDKDLIPIGQETAACWTETSGGKTSKVLAIAIRRRRCLRRSAIRPMPALPQAPANLGITAESLVRQITHLERVADQEALLQVYLIELSSVTLAATRGLAAALRNRAGNYLLVLTHDYERIDFVLLEKVAPRAEPGQTIAQKQVAVRPRILTVERRNPTKVDLRVLRRLSYTEPDAIAQYEKLKSAFDIADWSEDHFNNRALFADYYLSERLRDERSGRKIRSRSFADSANYTSEPPAVGRARAEAELRSGLLDSRSPCARIRRWRE